MLCLAFHVEKTELGEKILKMPEHIVELNENMKSPIQKSDQIKYLGKKAMSKEIYQNRIRKKNQVLYVAIKKIQTKQTNRNLLKKRETRG